MNWKEEDMKYTALGIGYPSQEHDAERSEWTGYGLEFDFASSVEEAKSMLQYGNYVCVAIRAHDVGPEEIFALRQVKAIPMMILPPYYSVPATRGKGYGQLIGLDMDLRIRPAVQAKKYMGIYVL